MAKFFCDSFYLPEMMYDFGLAEYRLPRQCSRIEEMAYEALAAAQGRWIPYFLGRHEVSIQTTLL